MLTERDVRPGMTVMRGDGAPFGKVASVRADGFVVRKPEGFDEDRFVKFTLVEILDDAGLHLTAAGHLATDPAG